MSRKYWYLFFAFFLLLFLGENVCAKEVKEVCKYTYQNDLKSDGSTTTGGPAYQNATITITIYDDNSHEGTSSSWSALGGNESIMNWGQSKKGASDIQSGNCPTYIGVIASNGREWYGFTSETISTEGVSVAESGVGSMSVYKWEGADTDSYTCEYPGVGYTIKVDTNTKTVVIESTSSAYLGVYYWKGEGLEESWFSEERGTEKCLPTVACKSDKGSANYYIFNDSMAASQAGYPYCENRECSGDDCDEEVESSCLTYNRYKNQIDSLYGQIENGEDDEASLYSRVHETEQYLSSLCQSVFKVRDYSDVCVQACLKLEKDISEIKESHGINSANGDSNSCNISERLAAWLIRIVSWIRYIVPVVIIILTILDFIKAIAADNEDEIKKVSGKFAKRLIVALIIFLLPLLLEFILGIFGQDTYQYCLK